MTEKAKNTIGAKLLSKSAMIFSSAWIAILTLAKGFGYINLDVNEIITSGIAITAVWTPTFVSIVTDKVVGNIDGRHEN